MKNKVFVLYHANCTDGMGAKYAAWKKYGESATYVPVSYGKPFPDLGLSLSEEAQTEVYILDFAYSREVINGLLIRFKKVQVLDHHVSHKEELEGLSCALFDMDKSGAVLAWEYFHPKQKVPLLLEYIQDRDLWKKQLPHTDEMFEGMTLRHDDMVTFDSMATCLNTELHRDVTSPSSKCFHCYHDGVIILKKRDESVKRALKNVLVLDYDDGTFSGKVGFVNASENVSDLGSAICRELGCDAAVMWYMDHDLWTKLSFRSTDANKFNVAKFAEKYFNGGGHATASGGTYSGRHWINKLESLRVQSESRTALKESLRKK